MSNMKARLPGAGRNASRSNRRTQDSDKHFVPPPTISRPEFIIDGRDDGFRSLIYAMVLGLQRLAVCREAFGSYLGLTGSQFAVLMGTAYRQGRNGVTIKQLSDHVLLAATHVTTEVNRLMRKNLLTKQPNIGDRRSVLVCLTPLGESAVRAVTPVVRDVNDALFAGTSARDLRVTARVLNTVAHSGGEALAKARDMRWPQIGPRRAARRMKRTEAASAV